MFVTEKQLRNFPKPPVTETYQPISHGEALDLIGDGLQRVGLHIANKDGQTFTVVNEGQRAFGTLDIKDHDISEGIRFMVGFANSTDKFIPLKIGFGSRVLICSNGMFIADESVVRKHTVHILKDIVPMIDKTLSHFGYYIDHQRHFFNRLKNIEINNERAHDIILRGSKDHDVITYGEIIHVANQWHEPSFDCFKDRNAWSLLNAHTHVHKQKSDKNGHTVAERQVRLARFFEDEFTPDLKLLAKTN